MICCHDTGHQITPLTDDDVLMIVNRYWNQLDEDVRVLLQRFDAEAAVSREGSLTLIVLYPSIDGLAGAEYPPIPKTVMPCNLIKAIPLPPIKLAIAWSDL